MPERLCAVLMDTGLKLIGKINRWVARFLRLLKVKVKIIAKTVI